ncbi:MAG: benzoate-CoA ligase family protein [Acidimicrobiales bacterium]|nr:benzoate-CoA ligase family protein [Acidimicrobiales bacterium]
MTTSGSTANRFNISAWLLDRHLDAGHGGRTAIVCGEETLRYVDVADQVNRAANGLLGCGLRREERVLLVMNDEPAFVAFFLAALRLGAVPVPTSPMLTAGDVAAIAADAGARVAVVSAEYAGHLPAIREATEGLLATVVVGDSPAAATHRWSDFDDAAPVPVASTTEESPGFWLYTSGTTGMPKGAMHRHIDPKVTADTYAASVLGIGPEDRCCSVAKLFFAYGLGNSLTFPFAVGACSVLNPARPTPAGVAELVARHRPTLFFGAPGFYAGLLDAATPAEQFSSVRLAASAGEVLPAALHERVVAHFGFPLLDGIGSTEALHIFLSNRAGAERGGTSGTPVPGYECKLCDEAGNELLEADVPGQLHIKGGSIATGYWCRREATQAAFLGEWNRTGDVYSRSADGYWTFLGRNNDMMKVGGIWVSPAEVENVLLQHPDVLEAVVVGTRTADGLETAVAFLVPRRDRQVDPDAIEAHCRARMAAFKRPRRIVVVDELPKTATGKVQRFALRQQLAPDDPPR